MRVYVPATSTVLRALSDRGEIGPAPVTAFAVTPGVREWYRVDGVAAADVAELPPDEVEELEYAAAGQAARASLRLVDADPAAARRRVVVAADVPDAAVEVRDDLDRGAVRLDRPVALADVVSLHVDDADAEPAVRAGAAVVLEADLGSAASQEVVDDVEGFELCWYATQELPEVLATVG